MTVSIYINDMINSYELNKNFYFTKVVNMNHNSLVSMFISLLLNFSKTINLLNFVLKFFFLNFIHFFFIYKEKFIYFKSSYQISNRNFNLEISNFKRKLNFDILILKLKIENFFQLFKTKNL